MVKLYNKLSIVTPKYWIKLYNKHNISIISGLILVHNVCLRGFKYFRGQQKNKTFCDMHFKD